MWSPNRHIVLGDDVGIGPDCLFQCDVEIGNKVLIAGSVSFVGSDDHTYRAIGKTIWDSPRGDRRKVVVEDDVWIGHGAIILSGSTIRHGSIVGAGAVVRGEVPAYAIVAGPAAKVVRQRFSTEEIAEHERLLVAMRRSL
jgi:acetyltransferase-like isoleucine patch superfamily enzyme